MNTESNFGYTDQNFEKIFDEEIVLLDELDQTTNHVSSHDKNLVPSH